MEGLPRDVIYIVCGHFDSPLEMRALMRTSRAWHTLIIGYLARATDKQRFDSVFSPLATWIPYLTPIAEAHDLYGLLVRDPEYHREFVIWFMAAELHYRTTKALLMCGTKLVHMATDVCAPDEEERRALQTQKDVLYSERDKFWHIIVDILENGYGLLAQIYWMDKMETALGEEKGELAFYEDQEENLKQQLKEMSENKRTARARVKVREAELKSEKKRLKLM